MCQELPTRYYQVVISNVQYLHVYVPTCTCVIFYMHCNHIMCMITQTTNVLTIWSMVWLSCINLLQPLLEIAVSGVGCDTV